MALHAVVSDRDVQIGSAAQRMPGKHQKQFRNCLRQRHLLLLATNADSVVARLKMTRTNGAIGLMDQDTVWADGLISVMFDDVWPGRQFCEKHWRKRWTGNMSDISPLNQPPQLT